MPLIICLHPSSGLCLALSNPANGQVSVTGRTSGSTAIYTCNTGYKLTGDQTRTCLSTGTWSGQEPTCILIVNCTETGALNLCI